MILYEKKGLIGEMYNIESGSFSLELKPKVFEEDLKCPTNTILTVRLTSDGYSADSSMDVGARDVAVFAEGLKEVYDKLEGKVRLEEPYGEHNFIEFFAKTGGHIVVKGKLSSMGRNGHTQELSYESEIDQTDLKDFVRDLYADFSKYKL